MKLTDVIKLVYINSTRGRQAHERRNYPRHSYIDNTADGYIGMILGAGVALTGALIMQSFNASEETILAYTKAGVIFGGMTNFLSGTYEIIRAERKAKGGLENK